jgi:hypothetical protein
MFEMDLPRTELLVNSIIAITAVVGVLFSLGTVAWQVRKQHRLESKRVEEEYARELLRVIDRPLDLALSNLSEVDYLRAADPQVLGSAEALHRARPNLMADIRNAYQQFTNVASTIVTILPASRTRRGIKKENDLTYQALNRDLTILIDRYGDLVAKYGSTDKLIHLGLDDYGKDPLIKDIVNKTLPAVRYYASVLLAELYEP